MQKECQHKKALNKNVLNYKIKRKKKVKKRRKRTK